MTTTSAATPATIPVTTFHFAIRLPHCRTRATDWSYNHGVLYLLACLLGSAGPAVFVAGEYRVEIWSGLEVQTLYLKDRAGRVVTSLHDYRTGLLRFYDRRPESYGDLTGDGVRKIVFETWTGGAHGSTTYHVWSLGTAPRCLLAYDKNNLFGEDDFEFRDLDGDGKREIVSWYDGFAYSISGAYTAMLPVVFRLEHGVYRERTRRYPQVIKPYLQRYRTYVVDTEDRVREEGAVGLYALAIIRRSRTSTLAYLKKQLPESEYRALLKDRSRIEKITRAVADRIRYPKAYAKGVRFYVERPAAGGSF